jgi:hypothetical protein
MLCLDDPHWNDLQHAYGGAGDVPTLLRTLASSPGPKATDQDEPWFSLWSNLCHQGDAYTASYAVVPHMVQIASQVAGPVDCGFFQLPAAIEVARRTGRGPGIPAALVNAYRLSIERLMEIVSLQRHHAWDQPMLLSAAAAQAVAKGHIDVAEALLNLDTDWISRVNRGECD